MGTIFFHRKSPGPPMRKTKAIKIGLKSPGPPMRKKKAIKIHRPLVDR
jgi:hypothetical protein